MIFDNKTSSDNYTFVIDGNYLMMRIAFAVDLDFKTNVEKHKREYYKSLCQSFSNLVGEYKDSISNVKVVVDSKSWRKDVEMIVPSLFSDIPKEEQQYKANRNTDEMPFDIKVVKDVFLSFVQMLNDDFKIPLITSKGAEGDDLLYVVSVEEVLKGNKCLLYTSDGDISQLVNDNVFVLKQMPRDTPNKIIVSKNKKEEIFGSKEIKKNDPMHIFNTPTKHDYLLSKFVESDVLTLNAAEFIIVKTVSGDKKDNIHPTFLWRKKDSSGKLKEYKPTGMFIKKGLAAMNLTMDDLTIEKLYDKSFYEPLLNHTLRASALYPKIVDVMRSYKANLKNLLSKELITDTYTPREILQMSICGIDSEMMPCFYVTNYNGDNYAPTIKIVNDLLDKHLSDISESELTLKVLKSNKFPKPFLLNVIGNMPLVRDIDLIISIYEQNLKLLHLDKKSIPNDIVVESIKAYKETSDIFCDMDIITNFGNLMRGSASSSGLFSDINVDDFKDIKSDGSDDSITVTDVDLDSDDILASVMSGIGDM